MSFLDISPPQGFSVDQELSIISGSLSPRYEPPQGLDSDVTPPVTVERTVPTGEDRTTPDGKTRTVPQ